MDIHVINDGEPIYAQIVRQVKALIAAGRLTAGEELPPIRVLAERLVVNPNTVARAYRELQAAGVVENRRTAGTYVSAAGPDAARRERLRLIESRADSLLAEARRAELSLEETIDLLKRRDRAARRSAKEQPS
jgi:GntR family transcriptional regulator